MKKIPGLKDIKVSYLFPNDIPGAILLTLRAERFATRLDWPQVDFAHDSAKKATTIIDKSVNTILLILIAKYV